MELLSKVEITNLNNNAKRRYTPVNPHEADLRQGKISIKSLMKQALLNQRVGDTVEVHIPKGIQRLCIESISIG